MQTGKERSTGAKNNSNNMFIHSLESSSHCIINTRQCPTTDARKEVIASELLLRANGVKRNKGGMKCQL